MELLDNILYAIFFETALVCTHKLLFEAKENSRAWVNVIQVVVLSGIYLVCTYYVRPLRIFFTLGTFYLFASVPQSTVLNANLVKILFSNIITTTVAVLSTLPSFMLLRYIIPGNVNVATTILTGVLQIPICIKVCKVLGNKNIEMIGKDVGKEIFVTVVSLFIAALSIVQAPIILIGDQLLLRIVAVVIFVVCCILAVQWLRREYIAAAKEREHEAERAYLESEVRRKEEAYLELTSRHHDRTKVLRNMERGYESMQEKLRHRPEGDMEALAETIETRHSAIKTLERELQAEADRSLTQTADIWTGIPGLDDDLALLAETMASQAILFHCRVRESMARLLDEWRITALELRELTANLLDNAIRAIEENDPPTRAIGFSYTSVDGVTRLRISDSGGYFSSEVLRRLGAKGNTTRSSGLGLANILAVLAKWNASFFIEEFVPARPVGYTKSISIRFDGAAVLGVTSPRVEVEDYRVGIREALERSDTASEEGSHVSDH